MKWFHVFNRITLSIVVAGMLALLACVPAHLRTMELPGGCYWAAPPLMVAVDESADPYNDAFLYGVRAWNLAIGRDVLKTFSGTDQGMADVLVVVGEFNSSLGAQTELTCHHGKLYATILVRQAMDEARARAYALHELGHAMGVGHSTNVQSAMYWQTPRGLMDGGAGPDAVFEPAQRILPIDARLAGALHPAEKL